MSDVIVETCDPREREVEIKGLFTRNRQSEFDRVFERAYRRRAEAGMRSWIGLINGSAVMHVGVTPVAFKGAGHSHVVGILSDLMVDESHRDFWAPVRLLRRMIQDIKSSGDMQVLVSTTVADASAVFKAAGFKSAGTLRRYVMPLSRPYLMARRITRGVHACRAQPGDFFDQRGDATITLAESAPHWRPYTDAAFYATRVPRVEFADATWLAVAGSNGDVPGWAMLSRNTMLPELGIGDLFWNEGVRLGEVVHAAARWGSAQDYPKLTMTTLQESNVAQQLERAGFFARDYRSTLLVNAIGPVAPPPVHDWFLPGFALSTW